MGRVSAPLTTLADPARPMPEALGARLAHAQRALDSLQAEERRLQRLGLELALARCGDQIRYWRFVAGILAVTGDSR
jgi:hypothetical protein